MSIAQVDAISQIYNIAQLDKPIQKKFTLTGVPASSSNTYTLSVESDTISMKDIHIYTTVTNWRVYIFQDAASTELMFQYSGTKTTDGVSDLNINIHPENKSVYFKVENNGTSQADFTILFKYGVLGDV